MARPQIDGVYELGHVLYALDTDAHEITRADIARVECFWTLSDMHSSAARFVFLLRDGRHAHVHFQHWHAFEQDEDFLVEVTFGMPDESPPGGWSPETAHLDRRLAAT
jgi:hypothetical protein